jgi:hypothetical protein
MRDRRTIRRFHGIGACRRVRSFVEEVSVGGYQLLDDAEGGRRASTVTGENQERRFTPVSAASFVAARSQQCAHWVMTTQRSGA